MTLYDYLTIDDGSFDTYDTVYDAVVTVERIEKEKEYYDKFCNGIMKLVKFVKKTSNYELVCEWADLIERNFDIFKEFASKHWDNQYEDDRDEFVYQWINEIHYWMAGYTSEPVYKTFVENYMIRMV